MIFKTDRPILNVFTLLFLIKNCLSYDIKIGIFISNKFAKDFFDVFELNNDTNKDSYFKSFILSTYSYGANDFFENSVSPSLSFNISSYVSYTEILDATQESSFYSVNDFCAYQASKSNRNWNIGVYVQSNITLNSNGSICDPAMSCILHKNYITLSKIDYTPPTKRYYKSTTLILIHEISRLILNELKVPVIYDINYLFLINTTAPKFNANTSLISYLDIFFKTNTCNNLFDPTTMEKSDNYLLISREMFCKKFDLMSPLNGKSVNYTNQRLNDCYFLRFDCYQDPTLLQYFFLSSMPPGTDCISNNMIGKCLDVTCVTDNKVFERFITIPISTTLTSTAAETSTATTITTPTSTAYITSTEMTTSISSTTSMDTTTLFTTTSTSIPTATAIISSTSSSLVTSTSTYSPSTIIFSSSVSSLTTITATTASTSATTSSAYISSSGSSSSSSTTTATTTTTAITTTTTTVTATTTTTATTTVTTSFVSSTTSFFTATLNKLFTTTSTTILNPTTIKTSIYPSTSTSSYSSSSISSLTSTIPSTTIKATSQTGSSLTTIINLFTSSVNGQSSLSSTTSSANENNYYYLILIFVFSTVAILLITICLIFLFLVVGLKKKNRKTK